jgi:hypothetical protein
MFHLGESRRRAGIFLLCILNVQGSDLRAAEL